MPKYDYRCDTCETVLEFEHPMAETFDWTPCLLDGCGGFLHKVFSPAAVSFKGQGWGKVYRNHKSKGEK